MPTNRSRTLDTKPVGPGSIIFWFDRDLRAEDNWALLHAAELANKQSVPLIAVYNLVPNFLGGGERQL
nr:deoxyribodipyrimidine photo-lyase [Candidatus Magasanikbacteria bacterium]